MSDYRDPPRVTFQDHYQIWLKKNNHTEQEWSYERWIEEWCFKDSGKGKTDKVEPSWGTAGYMQCNNCGKEY